MTAQARHARSQFCRSRPAEVLDTSLRRPSISRALLNRLPVGSAGTDNAVRGGDVAQPRPAVQDIAGSPCWPVFDSSDRVGQGAGRSSDSTASVPTPFSVNQPAPNIRKCGFLRRQVSLLRTVIAVRVKSARVPASMSCTDQHAGLPAGYIHHPITRCSAEDGGVSRRLASWGDHFFRGLHRWL